MPDFEVNEGYIAAGRRRADAPRPAAHADEHASADDHSVNDEDIDEAPAAAVAARHTLDALDVFDALDVLEHVVEEQVPSTTAGAAAEVRKLPEETPIVRRVRHLAYGHVVASSEPERRVGVTLIARRRRLARRACPYGWRVHMLGTPPRHRRRLWTLCHGQLRPPGSPS